MAVAVGCGVLAMKVSALEQSVAVNRQAASKMKISLFLMVCSDVALEAFDSLLIEFALIVG
jgi:hypothetical protein